MENVYEVQNSKKADKTYKKTRKNLKSRRRDVGYTQDQEHDNVINH